LKLDKLINDSKLVERLDKLDPDNASGSKNDGINYWKGKKIVSMAEWKKKIGRNDKPFQEGREDQRIKEALQYFPDDYEKSLFTFVVPLELKEAGDKWYNQYLELMQFRNNLKCSRLLCFGCLLCPDKEKSGKLVGISRLIAKAIEVDSQEEEEEEEDNSNSTTTTPPLYPCPVLNRFKCPYDRKDMKEKQKYQQHLVRNEEEVKEEKEDSNSYDVDYLFLLSDYSFRLESAFIKAKKEGSAVPVKNVEDIYNALTDRETLDKLLQQELDEELLEYKDEIVEFFMSIKDTIRMEDLTFYNRSDI
jgi:hypothetical protein